MATKDLQNLQFTRRDCLRVGAALAAAAGGLGIARLLSYQVWNEVEQGAIRLLLEPFEEAPWPVHVVHREDKLGSSKVRSFIDHMVENLRNHPTLNQR